MPDRTLEYSRRAAEQAERLYAHEEALRHYERARLCAEQLNQPDQLAAIHEWMGDVYHVRGGYLSAIEAYQRALELAVSATVRARLKGKIGAVYVWNVDERGPEFLQAALNELDPETQASALAHALVWLGRVHWHRMQFTQAIEFCERARLVAERVGDVIAVSSIYRHLAGAYGLALRFDQSMEWARRCIALGEQKAYPIAVLEGYATLAQSSLVLGKWRDALDFGARAQEVAEKMDRPVPIAWGYFYRQWALYEQGDL